MILKIYFKFLLTAYFIVGMHIILASPGGTGLYLSYNVIAWLFVVVLISLGLWQITLNKKLYYHKIHLYLLLVFLCLILPLFYNTEFSDEAIPRVLGLSAGLLLLFSFSQFNFNKQDNINLLIIVLIGIALEALFGLVQLFILQDGDWGGYKIGISRPHGVFLQPNVMASFMATGIALSLYLSVQTNSLINEKRKQKLFLLFSHACLFCCSFLVIILQSRTGYLGSLLSLAFLTPYLYQQTESNNNRKQLFIQAIILLLAISSALTFLTNNQDAVTRSSQIYQSTGARSEIYTVSTQMIKQHPLTGVGYGHFERSFLDTYNQHLKTHPDMAPAFDRLSHPHNELLLWISEGGVAPLVGFILFIVSYFLLWLKIKKVQRFALLALLSPILLHSQLEFPFYSAVSHFIVFLILLWTLEIHTAQFLSTITLNKTLLLRFFSLLLPIIFIPFLLTTLHTAYIIVNYEKNGYDNIHNFTKIINPIAWQNRLDTNIYTYTLITGLEEHNADKLNAYVQWGLQRVKLMPRKSIYIKMLFCLKILDNHALYQQVLTDAKYTYPLENNWQQDFLADPVK